MSRILFDAFDAAPTVTASIAADLTSELTAAAQVVETIPASIAAAFGDELTAAASVSVTPPPVQLSVAAGLTDELGAAAVVATSIFFIPPAPGDPRVAVVTHSP